MKKGPPSSTTPSSTEFACNPSYLSNAAAYLKLIQTLISLICFGLVMYYFRIVNPSDKSYVGTVLDQSAGFFLCVSFGFFLISALTLIGSLVHPYTAHTMPRTTFEMLLHFFACIMYFAGGIALIAITVKNNKQIKTLINVNDPGLGGKIAAGVLGLLNSVLHGVSLHQSNQLRSQG
ncbi:MARVEL domain-containing protein [Caerostris extrusa]|uniref:MARVEL domain-containing protein n=1 Tax=Caerostris extrusa TaxID=172846 RepID=A0AAV4UHB5_CAEEX|nr:MARVEL domain-containing protein [Caerostris extrusa]